MNWRRKSTPGNRAGRRGPARAPHVLILVQNMSVPLDRRVWMECLTLVDGGYRVSVICPKGPGDRARETLAGVRIRRYAPPKPARGLGGLVYECVYSWLRTALVSLRIYTADPFDVIQACNPPDTFFALALAYKAVGVHFVYDQHDLCPEIFRSRFGRDDGMVLRMLLWLEGRTYRAADHVISTNESYQRVALGRGHKPEDRVTVVRSGPDPSVMRAGTEHDDLRHGRDHLACYLGIMGHQDRVDLLVRAIDDYVHRRGRTDCHFALLGYGDCYDDLVALTGELGLEDWITFTGQADLPTIDAYFSTASLGLAPDPKTVFNDVSTMNKVIEYMAYGLPVVSFDLAETAVSAGPAALLVDDDDPGAFAGAIALLLDDPVRRGAMGRVGRDRVENKLGWPNQVKPYLSVYDRLTGGVPTAAVPPLHLVISPTTPSTDFGPTGFGDTDVRIGSASSGRSRLTPPSAASTTTTLTAPVRQ
jgi:glycosyltransferase involved in cell wall biosynthesis